MGGALPGLRFSESLPRAGELGLLNKSHVQNLPLRFYVPIIVGIIRP